MLKIPVTFPWLATMVLAPAAFAQTGSVPNGAAVSTPTSSSEFFTEDQVEQWRSSKLDRLAVYDHDHHYVGQITDVLVGRDGKATLVMGMGGFLGMGEHQVALSFNQITWEQGSGNTYRSYPSDAVVNMTADQLKGLPEFYYGSPAWRQRTIAEPSGSGGSSSSK
jgi:hypothetical protein